MKKKNRIADIGKNYDIYKYQICPFERLKIGESTLIHPLRNEGYEYVTCVRDAKNNRVIEIINGHSYKYIEMMSGYMLNKQRIIDNKRYAICPIYMPLYELTDDEIRKIKEIENKLDNNEEFIDGNYILTNSEYRDCVQEYNHLENKKENKKVRLKWIY